MNAASDFTLARYWEQGDGISHAVAVVLLAMSLVSWFFILAKSYASWRVRRSDRSSCGAMNRRGGPRPGASICGRGCVTASTPTGSCAFCSPNVPTRPEPKYAPKKITTNIGINSSSMMVAVPR